MPTFYNQATLSYNNTVTGSNIVQGELVEAISAVKTAVVDSYTNGSTVTYIVSIVNSGATPLTGSLSPMTLAPTLSEPIRLYL